MLISCALILILGFILSGIFKKLRLPGLIGMVLTGIILGPHILNLIDPSILNISADLREIALIVILVRAGLNLSIEDLKKVGRPAILMAFIPATFEIIGAMLIAPPLLGVSVIEAGMIGSMLAAVSPAVIVPKMLNLQEKGYGTDKRIPQLIMAGSSADDIYCIVLFTAFLGMSEGSSFDWITLLKVPISMITGLIAGGLIGYMLVLIFRKINVRDTIKVLTILGFSFLLVGFEHNISSIMPFSGLLAVMAIGGVLLKYEEKMAKPLSIKFSKVWVAAELIVFVLVGAAVDLNYVSVAGIGAVEVIFGALMFRMVGVFISLIKSGLNFKEQIFCNIAYFPKATVQAAVGGVPLAMGIASGNIILCVAVLSIIITAPLGAIGVDLTYKKLLNKESNIDKINENPVLISETTVD